MTKKFVFIWDEWTSSFNYIPPFDGIQVAGISQPLASRPAGQCKSSPSHWVGQNPGQSLPSNPGGSKAKRIHLSYNEEP